MPRSSSHSGPLSRPSISLRNRLPPCAAAQELARAHAMLLLIHVIDPVGYAFPAGAPRLWIMTRPREELAKIEAEVRRQGSGAFAGGNGSCASAFCCRCGITKRRWLVLGTRPITGAGARPWSGHAAAAGALALPHPDRPPDRSRRRGIRTMEQRVGGNGFFSRFAERPALCAACAGGHLIVMHSTRWDATKTAQLSGAAALPCPFQRIAPIRWTMW